MISNSMKYVLFFSFETELRYTFQFLKALEKSVNEKFKNETGKRHVKILQRHTLHCIAVSITPFSTSLVTFSSDSSEIETE